VIQNVRIGFSQDSCWDINLCQLVSSFGRFEVSWCLHLIEGEAVGSFISKMLWLFRWSRNCVVLWLKVCTGKVCWLNV